MDVMLSKAQSCLLGALIGDATGTRLEFMSRLPTDAEVAIALDMPGGGPFDLAPGQCTDDGEMTISLARGLLDASDDEDGSPAQAVARRYYAWFQSDPFDRGMTTSMAFRWASPERGYLMDSIQASAEMYNMDSKANGALMRATPLGLWSVHLSKEAAIRIARQDAKLTHPNLSCQWATVAYVVAIRHLLLHPQSDPHLAFSAAKVCLEQAGSDAQEVLQWLHQAELGVLPNGYPQAGFVKIAFTHAFFHLRQQTSFIEAIRATLSIGGDTDTNACIVGGLVGARLGMEHLPAFMVQKVLTVDTRLGVDRPSWLVPHDALDLATQLIRKRVL